MITSVQPIESGARRKMPLLTVAIVGTQLNPDALAATLPVDHCQLVIIESTNHAYDHQASRTHLVVLCIDFDDTRGLQVLSMLKADIDTATIPVLTYVTKSPGRRDCAASALWVWVEIQLPSRD